MRGTSEALCIVHKCDNYATENTGIDLIKQKHDIDMPLYCVCHVKGHTLRVKEYSNAYSLIECETSTCSYEERVDVAVGCKDIQVEMNKQFNKQFDEVKQLTKCQCGCTMSMPHSHLVLGYSCPCEQGLTNTTL